MINDKESMIKVWFMHETKVIKYVKHNPIPVYLMS